MTVCSAGCCSDYRELCSHQYSELAQHVHRICQTKGLPPGHHLIEEVTSSAILKIQRYWEKGVTMEKARHILSTITVNLLIEAGRRNGTQKRGAGRIQSIDSCFGLKTIPDETQPLPFDGIIQRERSETIALWLDQVAPQYRQVLVDHYLEQMSYKEIALKRGISIGSVGVYQQRGLEKLRSIASAPEVGWARN